MAAAQALTYKWPRSSVATAVLLTDGAVRYVDLFDPSSWPKALTQLSEGGPTTLLKLVTEIEDSDLDGIQWKRSKAHDDATIAVVTSS